MSKKNNFVVSDQEIMSQAHNYRNYLCSLIHPFIRGDVLEIGSGIGNITEMIIKSEINRIDSICCIEKENDCISELNKKLTLAGIKNTILQGAFPEVMPNTMFDTIYHYNVLEHIDDDLNALRKTYELLKPGGIQCVFVPAFQCIYGSMDKKLEHFRRYNKAQLIKDIKATGFSIIKQHYCNFFGFFGWFFNNRILRITSQRPNQVFFFDKILVPFQSKLEKIITFPLGQNIFIVMKK